MYQRKYCGGERGVSEERMMKRVRSDQISMEAGSERAR